MERTHMDERERKRERERERERETTECMDPQKNT
jgi:hypothetical protein